MNIFAAIGFTGTMLALVVIQKFPEWKRRFDWWMLPEEEKQRRIAKHLSLICRPAFGPKLFRQIYK